MRPRLRNFILRPVAARELVVRAAAALPTATSRPGRARSKARARWSRSCSRTNTTCELRSAAALALVDMERHDVDGVAELLAAIGEARRPARATSIIASARAGPDRSRCGAGSEAPIRVRVRRRSRSAPRMPRSR